MNRYIDYKVNTLLALVVMIWVMALVQGPFPEERKSSTTTTCVEVKR